MSDVFLFQRFVRLLKSHWVENFYFYLWFVIFAMLIDIILNVLIFSADESHRYPILHYSGQVGWYASGLFFSGLIFAGLYFRHMTNPGSALITLMRPASAFEKWLVMIVVVSVLFPLVYTFFYSLLQYPAVQLAKSLYVASESGKNIAPDFSFYVPFFTSEAVKDTNVSAPLMLRMQIFTMITFWILQSLLLMGTIFFKQSPVLRTVLLAFLLTLVFSGFAPRAPVQPFWGASAQEQLLFGSLEQLNSFMAWIGLLGILWASLFYHLKEREAT